MILALFQPIKGCCDENYCFPGLGAPIRVNGSCMKVSETQVSPTECNRGRRSNSSEMRLSPTRDKFLPIFPEVANVPRYVIIETQQNKQASAFWDPTKQNLCWKVILGKEKVHTGQERTTHFDLYFGDMPVKGIIC